MRRLLLPLFLLLFALALPGLAAPEAPAIRITDGANLVALEAWPESGQIIARQADGWRIVALGDGSRSPTEPLADRNSPLTLDQGGDGHAILLDGQALWRTESEIVNQAVLGPDGQWLVAVRTPRGSETAARGELWRLDIPSGEWTALTRNSTAEGFPLISPDGTRVAFLRDGDLWVIPADQSTTEALADPAPEAAAANEAPFSHTPPASIRVKHVSEGVSNPNTCRPGVPNGRIDVIPFEEYIKRVTPYESPRSWHIETLKAQAVAARSYGWHYVLNPAGPDYDVTDTTSHQYMCDGTFPETNVAVDATAGQHLSYAGQILKAFFSAENSSPTRQYPNWEPISAVDEPMSFGYTRNGHGWGFSQWGGKRHADAGWSYLQILRHYYSNVSVEPPAGNTRTLLDIANRPEVSYLRGSAAFVQLNANNNSLTRLRSWYNPGSGWQMSGWQDRSYDPTLGWWHLFDLRAIPDTPYDSYRLEAATIPENVGLDPRPVLRLGIDRTPPTLDVALSQSGSSVTLDLSGDDGLSGLERRGYSLGAWQQEAEAVPGAPVVADPTASGGAALAYLPGSQGAQTVSFAPVALEPGHYRVWFRLRTTGVAQPSGIATLRLQDNLSPTMQRGIQRLRGADFAGEGWEWFYADADTTSAYGGTAAAALTPQLSWPGEAPLWIDRVVVATRPSSAPSQITLNVPSFDRVLVYASDRAHNIALVQCDINPGGAASRAPSAPSIPTDDTLTYLPLVMKPEPLPTPTPTPTPIPSSSCAPIN